MRLVRLCWETADSAGDQWESRVVYWRKFQRLRSALKRAFDELAVSQKRSCKHILCVLFFSPQRGLRVPLNMERITRVWIIIKRARAQHASERVSDGTKDREKERKEEEGRRERKSKRREQILDRFLRVAGVAGTPCVWRRELREWVCVCHAAQAGGDSRPSQVFNWDACRITSRARSRCVLRNAELVLARKRTVSFL